MKQVIRLSLIIAIFGLTMVACGGADESPAAPAPAPAAPTAAPAAPAPAPTTPPPAPPAAPAPPPAEATGFLLKAPEDSPKRGGTIRTAWGATTSNFDMHQGGNSNVLTQMYSNLVRRNPADGCKGDRPRTGNRLGDFGQCNPVRLQPTRRRQVHGRQRLYRS